MNAVHGGPLIARGTLATWELDYRARLAALEEERELARMQDELRAEIEVVQARLSEVLREREALLQSLGLAQKVMRDLRGSRAFRIMRRLGRWGSIDRDIRRVVDVT